MDQETIIKLVGILEENLVGPLWESFVQIVGTIFIGVLFILIMVGFIEGAMEEADKM
ncbi:hypothetical protein KAR26_01120 [Candidatus Parcubacteria bacterium]|nr:hypothetical protein [Candidatus Parcubacteria bacterium]